jgi:hypothetical protein
MNKDVDRLVKMLKAFGEPELTGRTPEEQKIIDTVLGRGGPFSLKRVVDWDATEKRIRESPVSRVQGWIADIRVLAAIRGDK